jgi:sulfur-carrier protein
MSVPIRIPTPLRKLTQNQEIVQIEGATIRDLIDNLEQSYPGLKERICDDQNNIRRFVNVFVNDEDIRFLQDAETAVKPGDEVSIVPAIAGG